MRNFLKILSLSLAFIQISCNSKEPINNSVSPAASQEIDSSSTFSVKPFKVEKTHEGGVHINESLKKGER